jgi:hypothetical protein
MPERYAWGTCVLHQGTKVRVYEKLLSSLGAARQGKRELDIVVSFVLGDTTSDAGKMIQLLVEEGYPWDVISELLDEDLPAYTTSLDAAVPGENVVLSAYSKKRKQWVAVQRTADGEQISAWAATECLARRLAGLKSRGTAARQAGEHPNGSGEGTKPRRPLEPATAGADETESGSEWRILF